MESCPVFRIQNNPFDHSKLDFGDPSLQGVAAKPNTPHANPHLPPFHRASCYSPSHTLAPTLRHLARSQLLPVSETCLLLTCPPPLFFAPTNAFDGPRAENEAGPQPRPGLTSAVFCILYPCIARLPLSISAIVRGGNSHPIHVYTHMNGIPVVCSILCHAHIHRSPIHRPHRILTAGSRANPPTSSFQS